MEEVLEEEEKEVEHRRREEGGDIRIAATRWGSRHRVVAKRTRVGAEGKRKRSEREAQGRCGAARAPPPHVHTRACTYVCARTRVYTHDAATQAFAQRPPWQRARALQYRLRVRACMYMYVWAMRARLPAAS